MATSYQFENRGLNFTDSRGKVHLGRQLTIDEALSSPFLIEGVLVSNDFSADDLLGQPMSCHWNEIADNKQKQKRVFHGYLTEVQTLDTQGEQGFQSYKVILRPWLWLLTFRRNYRVFQQKNLGAILSEVFDDAGFGGRYTLGSLPSDERNYCVQYDETDFEFVQRLLAEQGIHYYFTHTASSHQLKLHDPNSPYETASVAKLDYVVGRTGSQQNLNMWRPKLKVHSAAVSSVNYDYTKAQVVDSNDKKSAHSIANNQKLTQYHFGANSVTGDMQDLAKNVVQNQLNQAQSNYSEVEAESLVEDLTLATQFSLNSHPDSAQLGKYAIEKIRHEIIAAEQSVEYQNRFICRAVDYVSFPEALAKPVINGLQTAIVVGGDNGQPQHDVGGRIKVQFHWDKVGGDSPSCWIRVAQNMASSSLGMQFIPRVGDEVLVSFVNNDPDQPVVIGSVYNGNNKPPYPELNSTQSGIKTQLGKQSNELRFDDKADNEQLYMHAAKDHLLEVENNLTETVKAEFSHTTEKAMTITGNDNYSLTIAKTLSEKAKEISIEADDKITIKVGSNSIELSNSGIAISCSKLTVDASGDIQMSATNIKMSSNAQTQISAGSNFKASANVQAEMSGSAGATVSSSAQAKVTGSAGAELSSSAMTKVSSSGITQVQGSLVQIN